MTRRQASMARLAGMLALLEAGWITLDGARALVLGDYITAKSGPYAGQLGLWRIPVSAIGIPPRSTFMKMFFAAYGLCWLVVVILFLLRPKSHAKRMICMAAGSLWFLPWGTISALVQIGLLWLSSRNDPPCPQGE